MIRSVTSIIVLLALLALPGCALFGSEKVPVAVDTFCLQKKRTWSVNDTPESIHDARVFNDTLDRRCGGKSA